MLSNRISNSFYQRSKENEDIIIVYHWNISFINGSFFFSSNEIQISNLIWFKIREKYLIKSNFIIISLIEMIFRWNYWCTNLMPVMLIYNQNKFCFNQMRSATKNTMLFRFQMFRCDRFVHFFSPYEIKFDVSMFSLRYTIQDYTIARYIVWR